MRLNVNEDRFDEKERRRESLLLIRVKIGHLISNSLAEIKDLKVRWLEVGRKDVMVVIYDEIGREPERRMLVSKQSKGHWR